MYAIPFLDLPPLTRAAGVVRLPGSKSISNRALLLAFLTELTTGEATHLEGLLDSEDTQVMQAALLQLKNRRAAEQAGAGAVDGRTLPLFLGNAGTAMRPLTAAMALLGVDCTLDGVARMRERPIGDLVAALKPLGCEIEYLGQEGYPPLKVGKPALKLDVPIKVRGDVSSQFLTALLLTLPLVAAAAQQDVVIEVVGPLISKPYIDITLKLLAQFGIEIPREGWIRFVIPAGSVYRSAKAFWVEADASSASYFIALGGLAATKDQPLHIEGVGSASIQGDIQFVQAAQRMGVQVRAQAHSLTVWRPDAVDVADAHAPFLKAIDINCNAIPDAAMTLAVMALYAKGTTVLTGIGSWRVKETDRIAAMAKELRKVGAQVQEGPDFLRITPPASPADWQSACIHTYDDHRMAMCFSLTAFNPARKTMRIEDPKCVSKTYPDYFEDFFSVSQASEIPVLCIDGPAACGKGTLAALVAQRLGYHYLDSGALYRLVGLVAREAGVDPLQATGAQLKPLAEALRVKFEGSEVWVQEGDGRDASQPWRNVSVLIRSEQAGLDASAVSAHEEVRAALAQRQRDFAQLPGLVAEGRDMGTVIFPSAALKVFLTASAPVRAKRRWQQLADRGISASITALCADLQARDTRDQSRRVAPLVAAKDALELDNTLLTIEQSLEQVLDWWNQKQFRANP